jgi:hypothetical protein
MKPAALGDIQPLSPVQPLLRLLRWQARTQVFHEELGEAERLTMVRIRPAASRWGQRSKSRGVWPTRARCIR